jgi:predicted ATP-binding protein involved in virulence
MENFRIESLEINKIGAFEHIKMDFPKKTDPDKAEIHILTGENGTGKSTILTCLTVVGDDKPGRNTNTQDKFHTFRTGAEHNIIVQNKYLIFDYIEKRQIESRESRDLQEYQLAFFAYSGFRRINNIYLEGVKEINVFPLQDSIDFEKSLSSDNQKIFFQWIANTIAKGFIAKGKGDISKSEYFRNSIVYIESAITDIIEKPILFEIDDNFGVLLKMDGLTLHFDVLSDGLKTLISWIGDLLMRMDRIKWKDDLPIFDRNFILFLDEIEVHLHPAWQRKILPVVQKLFKNAQIFISTHSPFVVGSVDGAWVHKLKKDGAYAVLDGEPILSEDAESYDTILENIFGITKRFGDPIEDLLTEFRAITREILKGNEDNIERWNEIISIFAKQERPDEIMSVIKPIRNQINRIRNQVEAIY